VATRRRNVEIHLAGACLGACVGFGEIKREVTYPPRGAVKTKGIAVLAKAALIIKFATFITLLVGQWPRRAIDRAGRFREESLPNGQETALDWKPRRPD